VQHHAAFVGVLGDRADLGRRVERSELGGLGDADGERLRAVLVAPAPGLLVDECGSELAVGGIDGEQLEAGHPLGGAALIRVDVRGARRDDGAPARKHAGERGHIGPGAVEDREGFGGLAEVFLHDLLQLRRIHVFAVGDLVAAVGVGDGGEHFGVRSRVVVTGESAKGGVMKLGHRSIVPVSGTQLRQFAPSAPISHEIRLADAQTA